jgi:putative DNA methylase
MPQYPKRLIEVDLPIKRISAHARREKSIRHGHISTLHIWWARRPLAACRAVICAALWPDPADEGCPQRFRDDAFRIMTELRQRVLGGKISEDQRAAREPVERIHVPERSDDYVGLRQALLDFIAEFANWDLSTNRFFLEASRALTQSAHEALGGAPGTRPLVVDPFAGGGSIPLEALRVGADAFASDLNPIPVLLNKVVLEYIPKYGQRLADEVRKWGQWIKEQAEKELAPFYPRDADGATPIAYLWARTILSEAPGQGDLPVEVPLMRSLWLAKKAARRRALRWVRDKAGQVQTETVTVTYFIDGQPVVKRVRRPLLEIFEPKKETEVEPGTVGRGSATCPVTGYTTKVDSVRAQLKQRRGGAADARLFAVVTTRDHEQGRFYRLPTAADRAASDAAAVELERRERADGTERSAAGRAAGRRSAAAGAEGAKHCRSLVPDEVISLNELRRVSVPIYGMERWGDLFSPRQALALTTLASLVREVAARCAKEGSMSAAGGPPGNGLPDAVATCLAFALDKLADKQSTHTGWKATAEYMGGHTFARQAIGMVWDWCEADPFHEVSGSWLAEFQWIAEMVEHGAASVMEGLTGHVEQVSATAHPLPDDAAAALITDPPYYDAVPYAYLSDFFYVWMRRTLADVHPPLFRDAAVPKDAEIVVDRPHQLSHSTKGIDFYERELTRAFVEGRRVLAPAGVGTIVFASKTTASWEAILKAVVDAGFVITGSWPIDTEMESRLAAMGQARLGSSVHIVVRPRENPDGSLRTDEIGDWRDVLAELPKRIHAWLPRLAAEGVVGADAIFACLGPALEVFSRYARVEKASGEQVTLREYLEQVWAAVSKEALNMIFTGGDATGFEEDARLTAMWLWTIAAGSKGSRDQGIEGAEAAGEAADSDEEPEEEEEGNGRAKKVAGGYALEYDAARKIAQGLGAHLEKLGNVVEVKGDTARLLSVAERTKALFGKEQADAPAARRKKKDKQMRLGFVAELEAAEAETGGWGEKSVSKAGETVLDRVHQSMILFAAGRSEALRRFLVEDGAGTDPRFWKLAQALAALYPSGTDERRWVEGVLGRKKGLGL